MDLLSWATSLKILCWKSSQSFIHLHNAELASHGNYDRRKEKKEATESALESENMPSAGHWVQVGCAIYL